MFVDRVDKTSDSLLLFRTGFVKPMLSLILVGTDVTFVTLGPPKKAQDGPKHANDGPKTAQDYPKTAQDRIQFSPLHATARLDTPRSPADRPKRHPRTPKMAPSMPNNIPRPYPDGPRPPKTASHPRRRVQQRD